MNETHDNDCGCDEDYIPPFFPDCQPRKPVPSCEICVHSSYDPGDWDVGIAPGWECECGDVSEDLLETVSDIEVLAQQCGHFNPPIVESCTNCDEPMNIPETEVEFWGPCSFDGVDEPCCSKECADLEAIKDQQEVDDPTAYEPNPGPCPHGNDPADCNACLMYGDFLADCAREDRIFGRR